MVHLYQLKQNQSAAIVHGTLISIISNTCVYRTMSVVKTVCCQVFVYLAVKTCTTYELKQRGVVF